MPLVKASIRINASPEEVCAVLLDIDLAPRWTAGLEHLDLIEGEAGQPGSIGHAHYLERGRRYILVDTLEEVTPNRRFLSRVTGGGIEASIETTLEPLEGGETRLTLRWAGRGTQLLTSIVLPLMKRQISRRMDTDLDALRRLVESG